MPQRSLMGQQLSTSLVQTRGCCQSTSCRASGVDIHAVWASSLPHNKFTVLHKQPTCVPVLCQPAPCAQPPAPFPSPPLQQPWQPPPAWPCQLAWPSAPACPPWQCPLWIPAHHAPLQSGHAVQPPSPACPRQQVLLAAHRRLAAAVYPVHPPDWLAVHQPLAWQRAVTLLAGGWSVTPAALLSGDVRRSALAAGLPAADAAPLPPGQSQSLAAGRHMGPLLAGRGRRCYKRCIEDSPHVLPSQ